MKFNARDKVEYIIVSVNIKQTDLHNLSAIFPLTELICSAYMSYLHGIYVLRPASIYPTYSAYMSNTQETYAL